VTVALAYRSRALAALAAALPVPLFAALGLSLPLPATVERLAAKLVPFADQSALDAARADAPENGFIVPGPEEARVVRVQVRDASGRTSVISLPRSKAATSDRKAPSGEVLDSSPEATIAADKEPASTSNVTQTKNDAASTASPPSAPDAEAPSDPTNAPPEAETTQPPAAAPQPTQQVVTTATTAVDDTVSSVSETVTTATDTAKNTVGGLVGGIHP
jgi:hypothetical protein